MTTIHQTYFQDTTQLDAFSRLKVSMPEPLFDNMSEYGNNTYHWEGLAVGSGAISTIANQNAVRLTTGGTTNTHKYTRQTKRYMRYQPGRSLNIEQTFVMSATATNSRARIGYFDVDNGIFLERATGASATTVSIVRRTKTSGSIVDNAVAQASWNVDPMTGSGPSGKTLDLTKSQIMFIQLQYLGVGRVQVGFVIDGIPYVCHQFLNANSLTLVYMSTGCLPVRGEVENTGTSGGTLTMDMICTSVSTGGIGLERLQFARSNGVTAISTTTTLKPLISIRAATLLGGTGGGGSITNRGHIQPLDYRALVTDQIHEFGIVLNGTLTGASWAVNNALSIADYDVSATAISGGTTLDAGYIPATGTGLGQPGASGLAGTDFLPLVYSGLNSVQDIISVCARAVTGTGTAYGAITWAEEF